MKRIVRVMTAILALSVLASPSSVWAQEKGARVPQPQKVAPAPGTAHGPAQLDIELDPLAYAADGFSVHGGLRYRRLRFDVGAFGLEVPEFVHGNEDFSSRFAGFGVKVDYRFADAGDGFFIGLSAGRARQTIIHKESSTAFSHTAHDVSLRVGYEISITSGFYVVPWVSVGHMFGTKAVTVQGDTFEEEAPVSVFPTVHLGYRL